MTTPSKKRLIFMYKIFCTHDLAGDQMIPLAPQVPLKMHFHGVTSMKSDTHRMLLEELEVCMRTP